MNYKNRAHAHDLLQIDAEARATYLNEVVKARGLQAAQEEAKGDPRVAFNTDFRFFYARQDYVFYQLNKIYPTHE
jgi:hypothetical protein